MPYTVCKKVPLHRRQEGAGDDLHAMVQETVVKKVPYTVTAR